MKNAKNILKASAMLALTLIITLTSCGTSSNDTVESEPETQELCEQIETVSLIGTWQSKLEDNNNAYYEAVISDNDEITIYQYTSDNCSLYYTGTFTSNCEEESTIYIHSSRDIDADTIYTDNIITFTYHSDNDSLYFSYNDDESDTVIGVYLMRISNDYFINYNFLNVTDNNDENVVEINADVEPVITDEQNIDNVETPTSEMPKTDDADNFVNNENNSTEANVNTDNSNTNIDNLDTSSSSDNEADKPAYTYTDKNEIMYATCELNIRSGPMTNFGVIGSYNGGDTVKVTGVCNETGWTRVDYNEQTGYVDSNYLTSTAPTTQNNSSNTTSATSNSNSQNTTQTTTYTEAYTTGGFPLYNYTWLNGQYLGRVRIPSVGINVAIYNSSSQSVTDAYDSANFYYMISPPSECNYTIVCSDHSDQGFDAIKSCTVGTALYIDSVDGNTYKYVCDRVEYNGHCDFVHLYDSNWNVVDNDPNSGLWLQTCNNSSGTSVTLVHFYAV